MVRVSSPAKLRPWSELTAKMVMGVVPALVRQWLTQASRLVLKTAKPPNNSGVHKTFNMGSVVRITGHNACISTPLWGRVSSRVRV